MLESQRLAEGAEIPSAIVNVLLSLLLGVSAVALGRTVGGLL
jgi:fluoride ion exporter CrcB/FEX